MYCMGIYSTWIFVCFLSLTSSYIVWDLYIYSIINLRLVMTATMVRRVLVQDVFPMLLVWKVCTIVSCCTMYIAKTCLIGLIVFIFLWKQMWNPFFRWSLRPLEVHSFEKHRVKVDGLEVYSVISLYILRGMGWHGKN